MLRVDTTVRGRSPDCHPVLDRCLASLLGRNRDLSNPPFLGHANETTTLPRLVTSHIVLPMVIMTRLSEHHISAPATHFDERVPCIGLCHFSNRLIPQRMGADAL